MPEPKRKFGYYCLPLVYADQLVGRMDCKSHREDGVFEIKALFLEPDYASRSRVAEIAEPFAAVRSISHIDMGQIFEPSYCKMRPWAICGCVAAPTEEASRRASL